MLSKSRFTRGINCQKSLWLYVHKPEVSEVSDDQQNMFATGTDVGNIARDYFPDGQLAVTEDYPNFAAAKRTEELIRQGEKTIYEATFIYDNTLVAVDILTCSEGNWKIYECKSSTCVKGYHIADVALQYYIVKNAGVPLDDAAVMYIDNKYERSGELEPCKLFASKSVLPEILLLQSFVKENIPLLLEMLGGEEPEREMGKHCSVPFTCDFSEYCRALKPAQPETDKPIPDQTPIIKSDLIRKRLDNFGYPLYFFDFETVGFAVPRFDHSRPYQQLPFQYSLHYRESKESDPEHFSFLAWPDGDPRRDLIEQLISETHRPGKILTYNVAFERRILRDLISDFPEYKTGLQDIINRLDDLMPVFRQKEYYIPAWGRKYSIKLVQPHLAPELSYNDLEIRNGGNASALFAQLYDTTDTKLIEQTRNALLKYSHLDTWAMVRIVEELEQFE